MTQMMKSIGMAVLGISLLGMTSGCGKKMVKGSAGNDHRVARASLKDSPHSLRGLAELDRDSRGLDFDLDSARTGGGYNANSKIDKGINPYGMEREPEMFEESADRAILTTPASGTAPLYDAPFTSSGGPLSDPYNVSLGENPEGAQGQDSQKGVTFSKGLRDIYFQFDSWRLSEEARRTLEANAKWLKANPHERITIEGHCDERGTQAYNYVLGEKRATMVHQYLGFLGVEHHQLVVTSFGKDKPQCHSMSESCFQENRRAHFGSDLNVASQRP
jgi:peptidoglycan-associated lipoprotein